MPKIDSYPPGTPCWADLSSTDVEGSTAFYTELFGWTATFDDRPEAGGYGKFFQRDTNVAGVGPLQFEGHPSFWNTYICVTDAAKAAQAVTEHGGRTVTEPVPVFEDGVVAIFQDPVGAFFRVWQPGSHKGAALANEPVSFSWNELLTRDVEASADFYSGVFGWSADTQDMDGQGAMYTTFSMNGAPVAGMMTMPLDMPEHLKACWLVYFSVGDLDDVLALGQGLGAYVMNEPMEIAGMGRFAALTDPQGAMVALFEEAAASRT